MAIRQLASPLFRIMPPGWLRADGKLDESGRGIPLHGQPSDDIMQQLMHDNARLSWQMNAQIVFIGLKHIEERYGSGGFDLSWLVEASRFIPSDRRAIFQRGLVAGLKYDLMLATHLLIPQIENSLRWILQQAGVVTTRLDADMTQDEFLLDRLLDLPKLVDLLGEDLVFDLKGLLNERSGANLRNLFAHGMVNDGRVGAWDCLYLWWIVLRLTVLHALPSAEDQGSMDSKTESKG